MYQKNRLEIKKISRILLYPQDHRSRKRIQLPSRREPHRQWSGMRPCVSSWICSRGTSRMMSCWRRVELLWMRVRRPMSERTLAVGERDGEPVDWILKTWNMCTSSEYSQKIEVGERKEGRSGEDRVDFGESGEGIPQEPNLDRTDSASRGCSCSYHSSFALYQQASTARSLSMYYYFVLYNFRRHTQLTFFNGMATSVDRRFEAHSDRL